MKKNASDDGAELRRKAEEQLRKRSQAEPIGRSSQDAQRLLHELQVHQIELEMQNEELRASREQVEEERERYLDLYDFSPTGFVSLNREGIIVQINLAGARLLGTPRSLLAGKRIDVFIAKPVRPVFGSMLEQVFYTETPQTFDLTLYLKNRQPLQLRIEAALSPDKQECRAVMVDVTERINAEEYRLALEAQLRESQKMEAIGILAGGIAHHFNNLLAIISGNVALARQDLGENLAAQQSLDEIDKSASRAGSLVRQILTFSRKQPQEVVVLSLRPIMEDVQQLLRATLPAGVELSVRLPDAPLRITSNAIQVEQVIMNLATNAYHAMAGPTGHIGIGLEEVHLNQDEASILGLEVGGYARLWVDDDGRGMDAATQGRIFEPFFTTKEIGAGTGLGLSIVHGIVLAHRGALHVQSEPGKGTTIAAYFPLCLGLVETDKAVVESDAVAGNGARVLFLDDEEDLVRLVQRMLDRLGYRTSGYVAPLNALEALRADPHGFDVVVSDFSMPGMSGLDVAREVLQLRPDLPVVIISGYITDELRVTASQGGVRDVLYKPNMVGELCQAIHRVLQTAQQRA